MESVDLDLTYVNYKVTTGRLIAWLFETAERHGVNLSNDKFKGEGDQKRFKKVGDYVKLAAVLATHTESGVRLPPTLALVVRQAITLRKAQASKFPDTERYRARNASHQHFTEELKFVLLLLENTTIDIDRRLSTSTLCSSDIICAVWSQQSRHHESNPPVPLDGELSGSEFDKSLAVWTFFEDMADIRDNLYDTWEDYATGRLCLTAAAVSTDTAFTIMEASCQEIFQLVPDAPSWLALTMRLKEMTDRQNWPEPEFLDFTCAKVAFRLNELCRHLRAGHLLAKRTGFFEDYEPARDRSAWSIEDQDEEDIVLLSELFLEVVALSRTRTSVPAQDRLTAGLRQTVQGGSFELMPMYVVFAAQIFLDIHHLLRDGISRSLDSLQTEGKRAYDIIHEHFQQVDGDSGVRTQALEDILLYAKDWIENDIVASAQYRHGGAQDQIRPYRFLRIHPILCGLKVFRLQILLQQSGIEMSNNIGSIVSAAHIYNAACRSGGLDKSWRDIDYVIELHTPKRVFSGSSPSTVSEYFDKFLLALDESQRTAFDGVYPSGGRPGAGRIRTRRIKLKTTSPVRDTFQGRYILDDDANMTMENIVAMSHMSTKRTRTSAMSEESFKFLGQMTAKRRYTTMQLLRIVREGVAAEEMHLLFDYIGLHDRVMRFLREILRTSLPNPGISAAPTAVLDRQSLVICIIRIFHAAKELDRGSTDEERTASQDILRSLAMALSTFLGESKSDDWGGASFWPARVLTNAVLMAQCGISSSE